MSEKAPTDLLASVGPFRIAALDYQVLFLHIDLRLPERMAIALPFAVGPLIGAFVVWLMAGNSFRKLPVHGDGSYQPPYVVAAAIGLLGALTFATLAWTVVWSWYRDRQLHKAMVTIGLSATGVAIEFAIDGSMRRVLEPWSLVRRVLETPKRMLIFTSRIDGYVIPKSAFADKAAVDAFVRVALNHSRPPEKRTL